MTYCPTTQLDTLAGSVPGMREPPSDHEAPGVLSPTHLPLRSPVTPLVAVRPGSQTQKMMWPAHRRLTSAAPRLELTLKARHLGNVPLRRAVCGAPRRWLCSMTWETLCSLPEQWTQWPWPSLVPQPGHLKMLGFPRTTKPRRKVGHWPASASRTRHEKKKKKKDKKKDKDPRQPWEKEKLYADKKKP
ncbi:hypothetical protein LEMLEM_LOCUS14753 [Lemmus lemmus]